MLDHHDAPPRLYHWGLANHHRELLGRALAHALAAITLSFGDAAPFIARIRSAGALAISQMQSLAPARCVLD